MKASPRQQRLLLELQELDTAIARAQRRLAVLPERAELAAMEGEHRAVKDSFMAAQREVDGLSAEITRFENDTETVRQRRHRDEELLATSTSPKEAQALQSELETLQRRQNELEERELELMESHESAQRQYVEAESALASLEAHRSEIDARLGEAVAGIERERAALVTDRGGLAAEIQRDLIELYEGLRSRIGIGAARLRGNVSEASNMALTPAELQNISELAEDEIFFCPGTGAILVRTGESGSA